jgi:hypothetical protein
MVALWQRGGAPFVKAPIHSIATPRVSLPETRNLAAQALQHPARVAFGPGEDRSPRLLLQRSAEDESALSCLEHYQATDQHLPGDRGELDVAVGPPVGSSSIRLELAQSVAIEEDLVLLSSNS